MLEARGFAENTQLPTLLKKSSQGCPGVWRASMEVGMHRVLCTMNTRPLYLSHYCTENSLSSAKEKPRRWVKSGLESAADGTESECSSPSLLSQLHIWRGGPPAALPPCRLVFWGREPGSSPGCSAARGLGQQGQPQPTTMPLTWWEPLI